MKIIIILIAVLALIMGCTKKNDFWQPAECPIPTKWFFNVNPENTLSEYPRPAMARKEWMSLNGLWDYSIQPMDSVRSQTFDGKILVPFPLESSLSGVGKQIDESHVLYYKRKFEIPSDWKGRQILLHFEAVDWKTILWVNDKEIGTHKGGYDPFSFDITEAISETGETEILLSVWDPTDKGTQPCGKQVQNPGGIFYTPVTGIWQSVWLEPVPESYIKKYKVVTDIDNQTVSIDIDVNKRAPEAQIKVTAKDKNITVGEIDGLAGEAIELSILNPALWSPDDPHLYDLEIELLLNGVVLDKVNGYFGMRKVSLDKDKQGRLRIFLNNEFVFQNGPLDQGFWPDGIYTAPTDKALKYDIEITKELGFNMLRKHVKIESRRFYYWCDKLGILVWQDMPSGDGKISPHEKDFIRTDESADQFEYELSRMINTHINHPSIVMWVPFNEGWGQYDTERIVNLVKELDPTRLVNNTSGWSDRGVGDVYDIHNYPNPVEPEPQKNRAIVLGEFGGLGLRTQNHMWEQKDWGYKSFNDNEDLIRTYEEYYTQIWKMKETTALSAVVYTQTTNVETEANGLLTYDRKVLKVNKEDIFNINTNNYLPAPIIKSHGKFFNAGDSVELISDIEAEIRYTTNGEDPDKSSTLFKKPFKLSIDTELKIRSFRNNEMSRMVSATFVKTNLIRPIYKSKYSSKYPASGDFGLIDNRIGTELFTDGNWQGFEGDNLDVIIKLANAKRISKIRANFLKEINSWIFLPTKIEFFISDDGQEFKSVELFNNDAPIEIGELEIREFSAEFEPVEIMYIKVTAKNFGVCPAWHPGAGGKTWIFIDEILFE